MEKRPCIAAGRLARAAGTPAVVTTLVHRWAQPLLEGRLVRRYERFLVDVRLTDGAVVRAHCVNPGRMEGLVIPGARVWLSEATNPSRALRFTWELIEVDGRLIGANTGLPNALVKQVLERRLIAGFTDVQQVVPEQRFGRGHRADFRLDTRRGAHWVEVKNCHLVYGDGLGYFPDSTSDRATDHVNALARRVRAKDRATVLFTLQRDDARYGPPRVSAWCFVPCAFCPPSRAWRFSTRCRSTCSGTTPPRSRPGPGPSMTPAVGNVVTARRPAVQSPTEAARTRFFQRCLSGPCSTWAPSRMDFTMKSTRPPVGLRGTRAVQTPWQRAGPQALRPSRSAARRQTLRFQSRTRAAQESGHADGQGPLPSQRGGGGWRLLWSPTPLLPHHVDDSGEYT